MSTAATGRGVERVVDGVRTWRVEYGDPSAPALLALHGFRGTHQGLAGIARRVRGWRVVVPDLPGFGDSARFTDRAHDVEGYARWAVALLGELGERPALLGHSFGSVVAAATARRHGALRALVLLAPVVDPLAGAPGHRGVAERLLARAHGVAVGLGERTGGVVLRSRAMADAATAALTVTRDPARRAVVRAEHRAHFGRVADLAVLDEAFRAARAGHVGEHLAGVAAPLLVVAGAADRLAAPAGAGALVTGRRDARCAVLPGTGHLLHYEAPGPVADLVGEFLVTRR